MQQVTISTMPVFREKLVHTGSLEDRAGNKLETRLTEPTVITVDDEQITVQFVQVITPDGNAQTTEYYMLFDEATHELPVKIGDKFYNVTWIGDQYVLGDEITEQTPTDYLKMSDTALYHEGNWYQGLILVTGGEETVATRGNIYTLKDRLNVRYAPYVDGEPALVSDEPGATQYTRFLSELVLYSREHECTATVQMPLAELSRVTLKVNADGAVTTPEIASDSHFYKYSYYPTNYQSILPEAELDGATLLDGLAVPDKFKIGSVLNVDEFTVYFSDRLAEDYIIITLMYGTTKVGLLSGKFNEPVVYPTNIKLSGYIFKGYEDEKPTRFLTDCVVQCIFEKDESGGGDEPEPGHETLYKLYWVVESTQVKLDQLLAGTTITPPTAEEFTPEEREGYTFAWGYYPETMPASNLIVNGVYAKDSDLDGEGKLTVTYKLKIFNTDLTTSEETYQTVKVLPGQFSPIAAPAGRQGYEWQGWQDVPPTVSENITIWGWFYQEGFVPADPENPDKKQFTARWKFVYPPTINYTLATQTYNYGDTITPPSVTLEGWVFDGWDEYPETMPAHDIEIGSSWHRYGTHDKSYEVKYELTTYNPGQEGVKETYYTEMVPWGETHTRIAAPTHPTLLFDGWYMWNAVGKVLVPESFVVTDDTLIWGKLWADDTAEDIAGYRKIHFQYRLYPGHIPAWFHYCYRHFKPGDTITLPPDPTTSARPFHHDHWDGLPQDMIMPDEDLEVYSTFVRDAEAVKIIYRTKIHGDITSDAWTTVREDDVYAGSKYTIPADYTPQLDGYVFGEWKTETFWTESGFKAYTAGTEFTVPYSDVIVDGEFYDANGTDRIPGRYFVHYQYRLYQGHIPPWFSIGYQWYKEGDTITPWQNPPVNPMRPNYQHDHWEGLPDPLVMPAHDIEVYSTYVYVGSVYKVRYYTKKNGDLTTNSQELFREEECREGTQYTITTDVPTLTNYIFGEWTFRDYNMYDGKWSTRDYHNGETFTMPGNDIEIWGYWYSGEGDTHIPGMYRINYRYKLYQGHIPEWFHYCYQHYRPGDTIVLPEAPVSTARPQYVHDHWDGLPQDLIMPEHDLTASSTFVYQNGTYTVTYKSKVHSDLTSATEVTEFVDTVTEGSTYTVRNDIPTKSGYIFGQWEIAIFNPPSYVEYHNGDSFTMPGGDLLARGYFYPESSGDSIPGKYKVTYEWMWNPNELHPWHTYGYQHYSAGDTIVPPTPEDYTYMTYVYRHVEWTGLPEDMKMPAQDITVRSTFQHVTETYTIRYETKASEKLDEQWTTFYTGTVQEGQSYSLIQQIPQRENYIFAGWNQIIWMRDNGFSVGANIDVVPITIPHSENDLIIIRGEFKLDDGDAHIDGYHLVTFYWRNDNKYIIGKQQKHYQAGQIIEYPEVPDFVQQGITYRHVEWTNAPEDDIMPDNDITITSWMQRVYETYTIQYYAHWGENYEIFRTIENVTEGSTHTLITDLPTKDGYLSPGWNRVNYPNYMGTGIAHGYNLTPGTTEITIGHTVEGLCNIYTDMKKDDDNSHIEGYHLVTFYARKDGDNKYYIYRWYKHYKAGDVITPPTVDNWKQYSSATIEWRHVEWTNAPANWIMPDNDITITSWMQPYDVPQEVDAIFKVITVPTNGDRITRSWTERVTTGAEVVLPSPGEIPDGYYFTDWQGAGSTWPNHDIIVTCYVYEGTNPSTEYHYAIFMTGEEEYVRQSYKFGDPIKYPADDPDDGYVIFGWDKPENTPMMHSDIIFDADYETRSYVQYKVGETVWRTDFYDEGDTIVVPTERPTKLHYTFSSWSGLPDPLVMPDHNVVVTAVLIEDPKYKLFYDTEEGASVHFTTQVYYEGDAITLPETSPAKTNWTFQYWTYNGAEVTSSFRMPASDVTFLAKFLGDYATVYFRTASDVTAHQITQQVRRGEAINLDWMYINKDTHHFTFPRYFWNGEASGKVSYFVKDGHYFTQWQNWPSDGIMPDQDTLILVPDYVETPKYNVVYKTPNGATLKTGAVKYFNNYAYPEYSVYEYQLTQKYDADMPAEMPIKEGYFFRGWKLREANIYIYNINAYYPTDSIYPQWSDYSTVMSGYTQRTFIADPVFVQNTTQRTEPMVRFMREIPNHSSGERFGLEYQLIKYTSRYDAYKRYWEYLSFD